MEKEIDFLRNPHKISQNDIMIIFKTKGNCVLYEIIKTSSLIKFRTKIKIFYYQLKFFIWNLRFFRHFFNLIFCFLSLFYPYFIPCQLLFEITKSRIIRNVIYTFYLNASSFGASVALAIVVLLIYSTVGYYFLLPTFEIDDDILDNYSPFYSADSRSTLCKSTWECFINFANFGLRNGGGIGDQINKYYNIKGKYFYKRWIFDIFFFLLINVILLNLVFGILINTFSAIRDKIFEDRKDQTSKCFICDFDKVTIDKKGSGFQYHILREHNMWNYIYFFINLMEKGIINLDYEQNFYWKNFKSKNYPFFPFMNALCIKKGVERVSNIVYENTLENIREKFADRIVSSCVNSSTKKILTNLENSINDTLIETSSISQKSYFLLFFFLIVFILIKIKLNFFPKI